MDQLAPVRIVLGYGGYSTEAGLRNAFSNSSKPISTSSDTARQLFPVLSLPTVFRSSN